MSLLPEGFENEETKTEELKEFYEYEINFKTGQLTGNIVSGAEAIKTWIWCQLQIPRYRYSIYSWDVGHEFESLIGQGYSKEHVETAIHGMVEDVISPISEYIREIGEIETEFNGSKLSVNFKIDTIFGKEEVDV